jgi:hypothetical protein
MEVVPIEFDGVMLTAPLIGGFEMEMPHKTFEEFGAYCGAGKGFFNWIVPEKIFGIIVSPACYIHDVMNAIADPTWEEFHQCSDVFYDNLLSIVRAKQPPPKGDRNRFNRYYRIVLYFSAVDSTAGAYIFWKNRSKPEGRINDHM